MRKRCKEKEKVLKKTSKRGSLVKRVCTTVLAAALAIGVFGGTKAEAYTYKGKMNVSATACTWNNTKGGLPTGLSTVTGGKSYYFNAQMDAAGGDKIKEVILYVKTPGSSSYSYVDKETASNYFTYCYFKYTMPKKAGTLYYYYKVKYKGESSYKTSKTGSVTVKYSDAWSEFKSDSRWKNGISWTSSQKPKVSSYSSKGCAAYCADVAKYVYGKSSPRSGTKFTSISAIQAGDILVMKSTGGTTHWIYVYGCSGKTLYTAEGNASSKVKISTSRYKISGSYIVCGSTKYKLTIGYHYK